MHICGIAAMAFLNGCGFALNGTIVKSEPIPSTDPANAYVIVGEEMGNGNLVRMSVVMLVDGTLYTSKGVQMPNVVYGNMMAQRGFSGMEFKELAEGRHGYRVWSIPEKKLNKGGYTIAFIHSVSSDREHFTPVGKMKLSDPAIFVPLGYSADPQNFRCSTFVMNKPGVYYLGELKIDGTLVSATEKSYKIQLLKSKITETSDPRSAQVFLNKFGINTTHFYDCSRSWHDVSSYDELVEYKKGKPGLMYFQVPK